MNQPGLESRAFLTTSPGTLKSFPKFRPKKFSEFIPNVTPAQEALLTKMLVLNPLDRHLSFELLNTVK
jgi:hypothetical protein